MTNLHDLIDALRAGEVWDTTSRRRLNHAFPEINSLILTLANQAVCFDMGEIESVPHLAIIPDLFRIPYPVTWFEGETIKYNRARHGLLACEIDDRVTVAVMRKLCGGDWSVGCIVNVCRAESDDLQCDLMKSFAYDDASTDAIHKYATAATTVMAKFIMALNCVNTERIEHPAPKKINKKRAAKGKQPLFSYWTLHLPSTKADDGPPLGGTHASPRLHLRRGHIRQYSPGKYTWVEACVVGSKQAGMVVKDYALGHS